MSSRNSAQSERDRHTTVPVIDPQMSLETAKERAISELQQADLPKLHLPAEQLAIAALQNLQSGHATDAAVWLSLASYRYNQEWTRILHSDINQLTKRELDVYQDLNFDPQLSVLGRLLRGEEMVNWDPQERLKEVFRAGDEDEEAFAEVVRRKLEERGKLPEELRTTKDLSMAYLQHLRSTVAQKRLPNFARRALARTPLAPFSLEALRWGFEPVSLGFCRIFANQLSTYRKEVGVFLADPQSAVRANAAVILGMNPNPDQISGLEQRWATEQGASVKLTLVYALARHGQKERVRDLVKALVQCPTGLCEEAMSLLYFLPNGLKADLDPEIFGRLAGDVRQRLNVRLFATGILGEIGRKKSLSPRMRQVLLAVAQEKNRDLLLYATRALKEDSGFSRELVYAALTTPSPAYGPLLNRLAHVATVEDLPVLRQYMARFAAKPGEETNALIEAAASLPSIDAEALLVDWFVAHPLLRRRIAFRLMIRPKLQRATEVHLATATDRDVRLLVRVIARAPDALALLQEELRAPEPQQRLFAAILAGLVGEPRAKQQLWSLVTFRDDRLFPDDARLRHTALSSLLWIALDEMVAAKTFEAAPSTEPTTARTGSGHEWKFPRGPYSATFRYDLPRKASGS